MRKTFFYSNYFIVILVVVFILSLIALGRESYRNYLVNREINDLQRKIDDFRKSNEELAKIKNYFQSSEFLEEEARKKLNFVKEGEKVIIVASEQEETSEEPVRDTNNKISNFNNWWDYLFNKK